MARPRSKLRRDQQLNFSLTRDELTTLRQRADEPAPAMAPNAWRQLKKQQRDIREAYFVKGKNAYRKLRTAVLREVREEYRSEWREFYAARKNGAGSAVLQEMRTGLIARQHKSLRERRDVAGAELRQIRRGNYLALLERQRTERADISAGRTGYAGKGPNARGAVSGPRREITPVLIPTNMGRKLRLAAAEIRGERLRIVESHLGVQSGWAINGRWRHRPPWDLLPAPLPERTTATFPSLNSGSRIQPIGARADRAIKGEAIWSGTGSWHQGGAAADVCTAWR